MLRRQHLGSRRFRQSEMPTCARGLLRMFTSSERGTKATSLSRVGKNCQWEIDWSNERVFVNQAAKIRALQAAYRKREAATPRDQAPSAGEIRSLGLLDATDEQKSIKHGNLLPTYKSNNPKGES